MSKVLMIAEAGINHNGDFNIAKQLVDAAKDAGADAIKFQTYKTENLAVRTAKKADYQVLHTKNNSSQYEMLKELELDQFAFLQLSQYCKMRNIQFMSSPFDMESIDFLDKLEVDTIKIPSGEITNYLYLKKIATLNKQIILSTGMATMDEIAEALSVIQVNNKKIILLHCTSSYPTVMKDVNLKAMGTLKRIFNKEVGYSDHTLGIEASIAAVALGAVVIEKHFTLDHALPGPDHKMSLEPKKLKQLVDSIRNIEQALGDGVKKPTTTELKNREFVRKSLVAARSIKQGEAFTENNLTAKRAGVGISPMKIKNLIGRNAKNSYEVDERIDE
ncbi:MAG: N-acetylneuraminate synthase [Lachnotalea sp.]